MEISMKIKPLLHIAALVVWACCAVAQAQTPAKPSIESFFFNPDISSPALSPSGKYLAVIIRGANGRQFLGVVDTDNVAKVQVIAKPENLDLFSPQWITDDRLYFSIGDTRDSDDRRNGNLYAINRDGTEQVRLKPESGAVGVMGTLDDGSDDLLAAKYSFRATDGSVRSSRLYRMNSKTLKLTDVLGDLQPKDVTGWVLDKDHQPRFAFSEVDGRSITYYRAPGAKEWVEALNFDSLDSNAYQPAFIDGNGVVFAYKNSPEGMSVLYRYDTKTHKVVGDPVFESTGFDATVNPVFEPKTRRLLGWKYETDAPGVVWLDAGLKAIQKAVDDKLSGSANSISCRAGKVCLVTSFSDQDPGRFLLYKPTQDEWAAIGALRTNIVPSQQGTRDFYRFTARDGMQIPVYVTQPAVKAASRSPAVVLVHGGPWVRGGHWQWNSQAQFLSSRGYVVIEPDFRGSTGYGVRHERAGWKQWGLSMQDDIADAANWAVAQGWVDKNRIAIAGASYGGYATLMGLIKHPEIFRCGINWVGVSDINLIFDVTWSDAGDEWKRYGMPVMVGDPVKDAVQLQATSPLVQAARLKSPLLMAYGAQDRRVPLVHGTKFRDAVMQHNPNVEWVTYAEEGHGWRMEKNNLDFWTRVETFLEKNLK